LLEAIGKATFTRGCLESRPCQRLRRPGRQSTRSFPTLSLHYYVFTSLCLESKGVACVATCSRWAATLKSHYFCNDCVFCSKVAAIYLEYAFNPRCESHFKLLFISKKENISSSSSKGSNPANLLPIRLDKTIVFVRARESVLQLLQPAKCAESQRLQGKKRSKRVAINLLRLLRITECSDARHKPLRSCLYLADTPDARCKVSLSRLRASSRHYEADSVRIVASCAC
jgi:hypothetical protein